MTARDTPSDFEAAQLESAAELARRANELVRLEALTQSWEPAQLGVLSAIKTGIEELNAEAIKRNQGSYYPDASCLNMPYGGSVAGDLLVVADTANSRLLAWRIDELDRHGVNACALAAQVDWNAKGDNRWRPAARDSVCWPYSLAVQEPGTLLVADSGNNRVMFWPLLQTLLPTSSGQGR